MKKVILFLLVLISVLSMGQVPQRFNKVIVTGDITSPEFIRAGSTVDSVLLGNGSARAVTSIKTDTTHLSARINLKEPANANIQTHISSTLNPHSVTKSQVGLGLIVKVVSASADGAKSAVPTTAKRAVARIYCFFMVSFGWCTFNVLNIVKRV